MDTTTTRRCDTCGHQTPYTPVTYGDVDLSASIPHICDACTAKEEAAEAAQRAELKAASITADIARVIPPALRETRYDHPGFNLTAWETLRSWRPTRHWLTIVGSTSLSKSRICALLAAQERRRGNRIEWTTANAFQWAASREFDDDKPERDRARHWLRAWKNTGLLVFDDFGKGTFTDTVQRHLFDLIDHRYTHQLPMLISANTHPAEMIERGMLSPDRGAPIIRRILEMSGNIIHLKTPVKNS